MKPKSSNDRLAPRICIVTPGQIGSNPRVVKEAQALHESGFEVIVIATRMLDRIEPRDQALIRRIPWRLTRLDLRDRELWKLRRAVQVSLRAAHKFVRCPWFADRGFSARTPSLLAAALRTRADLYIAHYPAALPAAAAAAYRHRVGYAYDAEDFHLGDWPASDAYETERGLVRSIESRHLLHCAHVTAASPQIADAYAEVYGIPRPKVVLNVFPLNQAPPGPTARGSAEPGPSVYWFSQTIGPDRGLECALRAIAWTRTRPHLYLRGNPAQGYLEELRRLAAEAGAAEQLHVLPPGEPDEMARLAAVYDVGLAAETAHSRSRELALTNKLFTYLLAGIPSVMTDTPAQRDFASTMGSASHLYPIDNHAALAEILDLLLGDPERLANARAEAYRLGQERYNWEWESLGLVEMVQRQLSGNRREPRECAKFPFHIPS